jgi:transketolase
VENLSARGAYEFAPASGPAQAVMFASGSEVEIAVAAKRLLDAKGCPARVVSVPSMERFAAQDDGYRRAVLGTETVRIAIEAGVRMGWDAFIGADGVFVGMSGFGASGPYEKLYAHFGITAEAAAQAALARRA